MAGASDRTRLSVCSARLTVWQGLPDIFTASTLSAWRAGVSATGPRGACPSHAPRTCPLKLLRNILADQAGATAIEYGLMAALISIAAITAMGALGNSLSNTFNMVSTSMNNASDGKL